LCKRCSPREAEFDIKLTELVRDSNNEELLNLCSSPNIIKIIKSKRMRQAWYVARMVALRDAHKILVENLKGRETWA
jgi:hypothetical protein